MALYMTQKMSSGLHAAITYYRKQQNEHPSHAESGAFTSAAVSHYATTNNIDESDVESGKYQKCQGVPNGGLTQAI
ncbi:hypothetical protein [[Enterobacter] lignolyticus]|uniref:Uncharacterized protein n=1 Tax=Enterobacter lignolyticus (strain SCF1) TaxID=701347 RepID=E3G3Q1_ENTLS|nr:hypothetical protein [[Enterobacter] lignolyticus]ADO49307.1 hypothetical protein Entcl_3061 [[Enterobacter] lignolyticus SCF1]